MPQLPRFTIWLCLLLSLLTGLASCQKADVTPAAADTGLVGHWQLLETSNGIAGGTRSADPKQKQELILDDSGQARFLLNGIVIRSNTYTVVEDVSILSQQPTKMLRYGPANSAVDESIGKLTATSLVLQEEVFDGFSRRYVRVGTGQ